MAKLQEENPFVPLRLGNKYYKLRIMEEPKYEHSKAGNPMLVFKTEIVSTYEGATTITVDGEERNVAGTKLTLWCVQKDGKISRSYSALCKAAELPPLSEQNFPDEGGLPTDDAGNVLTYTGRTFIALCNSKPAEQGAEPVISPSTGKPEIRYNHNIVKVDGE